VYLRHGISLPALLILVPSGLDGIFLLWRQMNTRHHDARALHSERQMVWHFIPWLIVSLCELEQKENSASLSTKLFISHGHAILSTLACSLVIHFIQDKVALSYLNNNQSIAEIIVLANH
jgi:hypothetical protein